MNHIYRVVWNEAKACFEAVAEFAAGKGKARSSRMGLPASYFTGSAVLTLALNMFALSALSMSVAIAQSGSASAPSIAPTIFTSALPQGGTVAAGSAHVAAPVTAGGRNTLNITQTSDQAILNWQSFNIGSLATVNFAQPLSSSVALNRISGGATEIFGQLNANGQVFLVNPSGILFGAGASVNVGGIAASTLGISDAEFLNKNYQFNSTPRNIRAGETAISPQIINQGSMTAHGNGQSANEGGGYVALLGQTVRNDGVIAARLGTVALAAGQGVQLQFAGNRLLSVDITAAQFDTLIDNKGIIHADGGWVLMSAQTAAGLARAVVNHSGIIQAQTAQDVLGIKGAAGASQTGRVDILADFNHGAVNASGSVDVSAPASYTPNTIALGADSMPATGTSGYKNTANGGFVETSAAHVQISDTFRFNALSADGKAGTWLIDPTNFTISSGGGSQITSGIGADTLQTNLNKGSIAIATAASGLEDGNIYVNAAVSWTSDNNLSLTAHRDIDFSAGGSLSGGAASTVVLTAGSPISGGGGSGGAGGIGSSGIGAIIGHSTNTVVTAGTLIAKAQTGIGSTSAPLLTKVANAALSNAQSGGIYLTNRGDITIAAASKSGDVVIRTSDDLSGNITVGLVDGIRGIQTTSSGAINLAAGRGAEGFTGADGVGISETGGTGGMGGRGSSIILNESLLSQGDIVVNAGAGGRGGRGGQGGFGFFAGRGGEGGRAGAGGNITVNAAISGQSSVFLNTGESGAGGAGGIGSPYGASGNKADAAFLNGSDIRVTAINTLVLNGNITPTSASVVNLRADLVSITSVAGIGSAGSAIQTVANQLRLENTGSGGIYAMNTGNVTVAAASNNGNIEIRTANGANAPDASVAGRNGGNITVGTVSDGVSNISGISAKGSGSIALSAGAGGRGGLGVSGVNGVNGITRGSNGGGGSPGQNASGGGHGGAIVINTGLISHATITLNAGAGGQGGAGGAGGRGGNGAGSIGTGGDGGDGSYGGAGGAGGWGGGVELNAASISQSNTSIRVGAAGAGGNGGAAGEGGDGGGGNFGRNGRPGRSSINGNNGWFGGAGQVNGTNINITAGGSLTVNGDIAPTSDSVSLRAGMDDATDTLTLSNNAITVRGTATDNITLQGYNLSLASTYSANVLSITTANGIGASSAALQTKANQLALRNTVSGGIYVTNTGDVTVAASNANGNIEIKTTDGIDGTSIAGKRNGTNGGNLGVGTAGGLSGITASAGSVSLIAGKGGNGLSGSSGGGGSGGAITVSSGAAISAEQSVTLAAGRGGIGGLNDIGSSGSGGHGGFIALNETIASSLASVSLLAGAGGRGGGFAASGVDGIIAGTNIDVAAGTDLAVRGAVVANRGDVSLRAGMNLGNTLTLTGAGGTGAGSITVRDATVDNISLQAYSLNANPVARLQANIVSLRAVAGIGSAGSAINTEANELRLENTGAGGINVVNDGNATVAAVSAAGDVVISTGSQALTVGAVGGLVGIQAAHGNVSLVAGSVGGSQRIAASDLVSITAVAGIGSAGAAIQTVANQLRLENTLSGGIYATNTGDVTVAARSNDGNIVIRTADGSNGANGKSASFDFFAISSAPVPPTNGLAGGNAGSLTVGQAGGLRGISATNGGNITLAAGKGGGGGGGGDGRLLIGPYGPAPSTGSASVPGAIGGSGGQGGAVIVNAAIQSAQSIDVAAGAGGQGGLGGTGGSAPARVGFPTGSGGLGGQAGAGGAGGAATFNAAMNATQAITIIAGAAGAGGFGGMGGSGGGDIGGGGGGLGGIGGAGAHGGAINVNSSMIAAQGLVLTAGAGGSGGAGGAGGLGGGFGGGVGGGYGGVSSAGGLGGAGGLAGSGGVINVNSSITAEQSAVLAVGGAGTLGLGGVGGSGVRGLSGNAGTAGRVIGSKIDVTAGENLTITGDIAPTSGSVSLRAGIFDPAYTLTLSNNEITVRDPSVDNITLQGASLSLAGSYSANVLSITTWGGIGTAAAPLRTHANAMALQSYENSVYATNSKDVTVAALSYGTIAISASGKALTVGTVDGLEGIRAASYEGIVNLNANTVGGTATIESSDLVSITAVAGIGSAENAIQTIAPRVALRNSGSGGIYVESKGDVKIAAVSNNGNIDIRTSAGTDAILEDIEFLNNAGTITVGEVDGILGISTTAAGGISLLAGRGSHGAPATRYFLGGPGGVGGSVIVAAQIVSAGDVTISSGQGGRGDVQATGEEYPRGGRSGGDAGSVLIEAAISGKAVGITAGDGGKAGQWYSSTGGTGGSVAIESSASITADSLNVQAGRGGETALVGDRGGNGGNGGSITVDGALTARQAITLRAGAGGKGSDISVDGYDDGGLGGNGGSITLNSALRSPGNVTLAAGPAGQGGKADCEECLPGDDGVAGLINGTNVNVIAGRSLTVSGAIAPTSGNVILQAGLLAGDALTLSNGAINAGSADITLQGHTLAGGALNLTGNLVSITAVAGIGSAGAAIQTVANQLRLENTGSGGIYAMNTGDVTVAAASNNGNIEIRTADGAAGTGFAGAAGGASGSITVGTVGAGTASLSGITTTSSGNVTLASGNGGNGIAADYFFDGGGGGASGHVSVAQAVQAAGDVSITSGVGGGGDLSYYNGSIGGRGGDSGSLALNATVTGQAVLLKTGSAGRSRDSGGNGGHSGSITLNAAVSSQQAAIINTGAGGGGSDIGSTGGSGGNSGSITLNAALSSQQAALLSTGAGGSGGSGFFTGGNGGNSGSIELNSTLRAVQDVIVTVGAAGDGGGGRFAAGVAGAQGQITGRSIDITAGDDLTVNGNIAPTSGSVSLRAGMDDATDTLNLSNNAIAVNDTNRDDITLQGYNLTLAGSYSAHQLSITTAGSIGKSDAALQTNVESMALRSTVSGGIYATNAKATPVAASSADGDIVISTGDNTLGLGNVSGASAISAGGSGSVYLTAGAVSGSGIVKSSDLVDIRAVAGIGSAMGAINTVASRLRLENTGEGGIVVINTGDVTVAATNANGDVIVATALGVEGVNSGRSGNLTVGKVGGLSGVVQAGSSGYVFLSTGGGGTQSGNGADAGSLTINEQVKSSGNMSLQARNGGFGGDGLGGNGGNVVINHAVTSGSNLSISVGKGEGSTHPDAPAGANGRITGSAMDLTAGGRIAIEGTLQTSATQNAHLAAGSSIGGIERDRDFQIIGNGQVLLSSTSGTGRVAINATDTKIVVGSAGINSASTDIRTTGAIVLNGVVSASDAGNSLILAGNTFTNNAGSGALAMSNTEAGTRWQVYSQSPTGNSFGSLQSGNAAVWGTALDRAVYQPTVAAEGNRFMFADKQGAVVAADDVVKIFGQTPVLTSYTVSALHQGSKFGNAFTDGAALAGVSFNPTGLSSAGAAANATRTGGKASGNMYDIVVDTAQVTGAAAYDVMGKAGTLSIDRASLSITANNVTRIYDGTANGNNSGAKYSGLAGGDTSSTFDGSLIYGNAGAANAGSYTLGVSGASSANYNITHNAGRLQIDRRAVTITGITAADRAYDGKNAATLSGGYISNLVAGQSLSFTGENGTFASPNAGNHLVTVNGAALVDGTSSAGGLASNYVLTAQPLVADATINRANLSITAVDTTRTYDGTTSSNSNGVTYSGFVNAETQAVLSGSVTISNATARNAGSYTLAPSGQTSGNYAISYANGNLQINKADATLTAATDSRIYNGLAGSNAAPTAIGIVAGDSFSATQSFDSANAGARTLSVNSGYAINDSNGGNNYNISVQSTAGTISQAALIITALDTVRTYNGTTNGNNSGVTYSGFVAGQGAGSLSGNISFSNATARNAGSYTLAPSGQTSGNYAISYVNGNLQITPAALVLTGQEATRFFGAPDPTLGYIFTSGNLFAGDSLSGVPSRTPGELVGSYATNLGTLANANYTFRFEPGMLNIMAPAGSGDSVGSVGQVLTSFQAAQDEAIPMKKKRGQIIIVENGGMNLPQ